MTPKLFCLVLMSVIVVSFGASVRSPECSNGDTKTDGKSICICVKDKWTCSFRNSSSCVSGSETLTDGTLNKESGAICLCIAGKLTCAQETLLDVVKQRVKRAAEKKKKEEKKLKPKVCREGKVKKEGTAKCMCIKGKFKCSFGKGKDCKFGPAVKKDGSLDKEGGMKCLCMAGKWECTLEEASKATAAAMKKHIKFLQKITNKKDSQKVKKSKTEKELKGMKKKLSKKLKEKEKGLKEKSKEKKQVKELKGLVKKQLKKEKAKKKSGLRVKRQRDTCKFGPQTVKHGEVYEFGTDCDCFNGNFKCNKYSRLRNSKKRLSVQILRERNADNDSNMYSREVSTNHEFVGKSLRRTRASKSTGASCQFIKGGEKITRLSGERFAYGLRCECMDGKITCTTKRV